MDPVTIALGGRRFIVRPLTLRQLRTILPAFAKVASLADEQGVDNALAILQAAISRDAPEVTREALLDMEATPAELAASVAVIARLSGLVSETEAKPGEAGAAMSTGVTSTAS